MKESEQEDMFQQRWGWRAGQILGSVCMAAVILSSCASTSTATTPSRPPDIPPESSFVMDFSNFVSPSATSMINQGMITLVSFSPSKAETASSTAIGQRSNWAYAALNVGFWNIVGTVGLAVPVASFVESFKHSPVQNPDYTWVWTYSVPVGGAVYEAELHGKYISNGVRWEMYITKQGDYSDFLWYYGESDLPATEGYWVLKNKPSDPSDLLRIDWQRDLAAKTSQIKYTNVVPRGPENGGYISYSIDSATTYDRRYTIYNKGKDQTTYIEWNSKTKEGRVRDSVHFHDGNWHYWDSQLIDTEG